MNSTTEGTAVTLARGCGTHPDRADPRPSAARVTAPTSGTLATALVDQADQVPDRPAYYLFDSSDRLTTLTAGQLAARAAGAAGRLHDHGVRPGDAVTIALETGPSQLAAFFGCHLLGAVPTIAEPPLALMRTSAWQSRLRHVLTVSGARVLVAAADAAERAAEVCADAGLPLLSPPFPAADLTGPATLGLATRGPDDLAFVQFTSGTTGGAKGVTVSHRALLANVRAIGTGAGFRSDDLIGGWLPLFHDMGLVGLTLAPFLHRLPAALMPATSFVFRPGRWLWALHHLRGTISAAPNFGYQLCLTRCTDDELAGLDLSAWRLAFNGSEVVSAATLRGWQRRMARYGFRPNGVFPVYGMAEVALAACMPVPGQPFVADLVSRAALTEHGVALPPPVPQPETLPAGSAPSGVQEIVGVGAPRSGVQEIVGVGAPLPGYEVRVVDTAGNPLPDRREGEVHLRGPSLTRHYLGSSPQPATLRDGWLHTGDLGYTVRGELFLTGRRRDLIIKAGRNYQPQEFERAAESVDGVRTGGAGATGVPDPASGTEMIVLVVESAGRDSARTAALRRAIEDAVLTGTGVRPDRVVLVRPGTLPRTTSGKLQRGQLAGLLAAPSGSDAAQPDRLTG